MIGKYKLKASQFILALFHTYRLFPRSFVLAKLYREKHGHDLVSLAIFEVPLPPVQSQQSSACT